jgi:hypothetical protein
MVNFGFREECETFLRTVLAKNPIGDCPGSSLSAARAVVGWPCGKLDLFGSSRIWLNDNRKQKPLDLSEERLCED